MQTTDFTATAIQAEHDRLGHRDGWRFLYGPAATLTTARVALVGINPGGRGPQEDHATYSLEGGSAFTDECWSVRGQRVAAGTNPLQRQAQALCRRVGVEPIELLAGNLMLFRSPSEAALRAPEASEEYGRKVWRAVFAAHRPALIIAHGKTPGTALAEILGAYNCKRVRTGLKNASGRWASHWRVPAGGRLVCLPQLSRFGVFTREECREPLAELLGLEELAPAG